MGTCSRSRLQTPHKTSYRQSVTRVHVWRCGPEGGHQVRPPHDRTTLLQCATSGATRHCCVLHCYDFTCPLPFQKESKQKHTQTHCTGLVVQALVDLTCKVMRASPRFHVACRRHLIIVHLARAQIHGTNRMIHVLGPGPWGFKIKYSSELNG